VPVTGSFPPPRRKSSPEVLNEGELEGVDEPATTPLMNHVNLSALLVSAICTQSALVGNATELIFSPPIHKYIFAVSVSRLIANLSVYEWPSPN
jgi:hypothetical protein